MEMKNLICSRNESPDTCMLCESEGQDYCMVCADACTLEDLHTTARNVTHDHYATLSECLLEPKQSQRLLTI